ncbi:MAG: hypothetical protein H6613_10450 [Ignavibacteriales bacterium]|nr:hypothetical protein [Ignavibacteriales bacterium]
MLILFLVFSAFVLFISCGTVDYIGKTYTATNKVDVFYTFDEVLIDHTVFGHITTSPGLLEDMQKN